jgi:hypothetical protein
VAARSRNREKERVDVWDQVGSHHPFPPEAPVPEDTRYVDAGAIKIGVEYRQLTSARFEATYAGTPFEELYREFRAESAKRRAAKPEPAKPQAAENQQEGGAMGIEGVSLHVFDAETGHEYLRFDCFEAAPHYHYLRPWATPEECDNHSVEWDSVAHGPITPWALEKLRSGLPTMLVQAGGGDLAARLDQATLDRAVDEVEAIVAAAQAQPVPAG